MSELGDDFRAWREHRRKKKAKNLEFAPDIFREHDVKFRMLSDDHFRVGEFDFWPSTGLFIRRKNKERGRGIYNLIKIIQKERE